MGMYILSESVKQGNGVGDEQARCAIDDDGFIVELDAYWWNESLSFTTNYTAYHMRYTFKQPDADDITEQSPEVEYIKNYIIEFENTLNKNDGLYTDYIDERSFAKWLLGHDILASYDAGGSNMYVTKKDSTDESKLTMSVLWDFDSACSESYVNNLAEIRTKPYFYFSVLPSRQSFSAVYAELFDVAKANVIEIMTENVNALDSDVYNELIEVEKVRYDRSSYATLESQLQKTIDWMERHLAWMESVTA